MSFLAGFLLGIAFMQTGQHLLEAYRQHQAERVFSAPREALPPGRVHVEHVEIWDEERFRASVAEKCAGVQQVFGTYPTPDGLRFVVLYCDECDRAAAQRRLTS